MVYLRFQGSNVFWQDCLFGCQLFSSEFMVLTGAVDNLSNASEGSSDGQMLPFIFF